jgi:uncharacterized protein (TIGR02466 family)
MLTRTNIFATPIFSIGIAGHKEINLPLIAKIYELQENEKGVLRSNVLGWQSSTGLNDFEEFARLKNMINNVANMVSKELGCDKDIILGKAWASINPQNASNQIHDHPASLLSGVYYLKVPEPVSPIVFYDPRPVKMFLSPEFERRNDYSSDITAFDPKEGLLLIFPSWLKHSVEPNMSEEDRISISFNYKTKNT